MYTDWIVHNFHTFKNKLKFQNQYTSRFQLINNKFFGRISNKWRRRAILRYCINFKCIGSFEITILDEKYIYFARPNGYAVTWNMFFFVRLFKMRLISVPFLCLSFFFLFSKIQNKIESAWLYLCGRRRRRCHHKYHKHKRTISANFQVNYGITNIDRFQNIPYENKDIA